MKKKNSIISLLSLTLMLSLAIANVNAETKENEQEISTQKEVVSEDQQKNIEYGIKLSVPNVAKGERLQVSKGTNLDMYGVEYYIYNVETKKITQSYEYLTNEIVSNFDNTKLGNQDVIVTDDGVTTILPIEVIEGQAPGEVVSIRVSDENKNRVVPLNSNITFENEGKTEIGVSFNMYDTLGRRASFTMNRGVTLDMASNFDTSKLGKQEVTITYKGLKTTFVLEVVEVVVKTEPQIIPLNGEINIGETAKLVDINNHENIITDLPFYLMISGDAQSSWFGKYDTSKNGVQNIPFEFGMWGQIYKGNLQLAVGVPEKKTIDEILSTKAQETIPKGDVVGAFEVPSGEQGAGTWTFNTELSNGTGIDVWSFHDEEWLKIGTYFVNDKGYIEVTFTADQLSPILLMKNDDINNPTKDKNSSVIKQTGKGKDYSNSIALTTLCFLSFCTLAYNYSKKVKQNKS